MDVGLWTVVECVLCAIVVTTAVGVALIATEVAREAVPAPSEDERGDLAVW